MSWIDLNPLLGSLFARFLRPSSRKQSAYKQQQDQASIEFLEFRVVPSALTITFDYSLDTNHFFDTQEKKDILQSVADLFAARITDDLLAIKPSGHNSWTATFTNPGTGAQAAVHNLIVPEDTIVIFVGGRDLGEDTLGVGGPGGYSDSGSKTWLATVDRRGQTGAAGNNPTDFGPWGGSITFDMIGTSWYFGSDPPDASLDQYDFYSVAMHEIGHVLGFGTSDSFDELVSSGKFTGSKTDARFDLSGQPRLADDLSHWAEGTMDGGQEAAMDPDISPGTRKLFTELDWAALDDMGWEAIPAVAPVITLPSAIPTFIRGERAVNLDPLATISNSDALSYSGSKLVVAVTHNANKYDFLTIKSGGGITKSGASLKFNGVTIGSYSNGYGTRPFKLTFNSRATDEAVQACLRNLTYSTISRKANTLDRTITFALLNPLGNNSLPVHKLVSLV